MPMLARIEDIHFLVGNQDVLTDLNSTRTKAIFCDDVTFFLSDLSDRLLRRDDIKKYPDVASFAFWIRRKNIQAIKDKYLATAYVRTGRGVVFHVAPSNIPVQFAISLTMGLLAGNINVVRVSNKEYPEVQVICEVINDLISTTHRHLESFISVIRYNHNDEITGFFSSICDARMIWGGDGTIKKIRGVPTPPRAVDLCFADRTSIAIINSNSIIETDNILGVAKDFYADSYYVDQNACSSPMVIIWTGNSIDKAKDIFWNAVSEILIDYELAPIAGSEKLLKSCLYAMDHEGARIISRSNKLVRVEVDKIDKDLIEKKCNMGYFYEYSASQLKEIIPILDSECQTVTVYGIEKKEVLNLAIMNGLKGVDRIVNMGQALGISTVWDGFDLIDNLSRIVG